MDYRKSLLYWARRVAREESGADLRGFPFGPDHGFGEGRNREFSGTVAFISRTQRTIQSNARIVLRHSTHEGFSWALSSAELKLPDPPPFLVTDCLETKCIYGGAVAIQPAEIMKLVIRDQEDPAEYLVGCREWICVLLVKPGAESGDLTAFSELPNASIGGSRLELADREDEAFGSVEPIG